METITQFLLNFDPYLAFTFFLSGWFGMIFWSLTLLLRRPLLVNWEDVYGPKWLDKSVIRLNIDSNEDDDWTNFRYETINGRRAVVANFVKTYAEQVNPRCMNGNEFNKACWNMYGTGRKQPDPVGSPNGSVAPLY